MNITSQKLLLEALDQVGNTPSIRFILFGTGSGNVYGVSSKQTFEDAFKDIQKQVTFLYSPDGGSETPEYDTLETAIKNGKIKIDKNDGYWVINVLGSDEGVFGLLDTASTNPDVQEEIKILGLLKHAQEHLANSGNI